MMLFRYVSVICRNRISGVPGLLFIMLCLCIVTFMPQELIALEPEEVLVVVNENIRESVSLGRYYQKRRSIPQSNLVKVSMNKMETCSRKEFDLGLAIPLREHLLKRGLLESVRCIVLMYGIPLRIAGESISEEEYSKKEVLEGQLKALEKESAFSRDDVFSKTLGVEIAKVKKALSDSMIYSDRSASVDSEIALLLSVPYPLEGWVDNPCYVGRFIDIPSSSQASQEAIYMVSRLDAPDPGIVLRIIDESIQTERTGLKGRAYFDARFQPPDIMERRDSSYSLYDQSLHKAAQRLQKSMSMPVAIDHRPDLFAQGDCPQAALY
ncbi:MAG TPA: TIGR03790 family protein, partial [Deltaproteobacteria bacterium]|nr:TIGR03790 family protein [Deltaproteobacteria bacterium]